jgi:hypothetical protein
VIDEDGHAVKLDLAQNTIVRTTAVGEKPIFTEELSVDPGRGNLFVPYGRYQRENAVYDLNPSS